MEYASEIPSKFPSVYFWNDLEYFLDIPKETPKQISNETKKKNTQETLNEFLKIFPK